MTTRFTTWVFVLSAVAACGPTSQGPDSIQGKGDTSQLDYPQAYCGSTSGRFRPGNIVDFTNSVDRYAFVAAKSEPVVVSLRGDDDWHDPHGAYIKIEDRQGQVVADAKVNSGSSVETSFSAEAGRTYVVTVGPVSFNANVFDYDYHGDENSSGSPVKSMGWGYAAIDANYTLTLGCAGTLPPVVVADADLPLCEAPAPSCSQPLLSGRLEIRKLGHPTEAVMPARQIPLALTWPTSDRSCRYEQKVTTDDQGSFGYCGFATYQAKLTAQYPVVLYDGTTSDTISGDLTLEQLAKGIGIYHHCLDGELSYYISDRIYGSYGGAPVHDNCW